MAFTVADFLDGMPALNHRQSATGKGPSRVVSAVYSRERQTLSVEYAGGKNYDYDPITPEQAEAFYGAPSWGEWLWDNVRERGSRTGHRVNVRGPY